VKERRKKKHTGERLGRRSPRYGESEKVFYLTPKRRWSLARKKGEGRSGLVLVHVPYFFGEIIKKKKRLEEFSGGYTSPSRLENGRSRRGERSVSAWRCLTTPSRKEERKKQCEKREGLILSLVGFLHMAD